MKNIISICNNHKFEYQYKGSITVFLSLILLLILSVTMTTIEAARVNAAQVLTKRAFVTAMDSLLAEYYLPLFEEYHIFGLDSGYGSDSIEYNTMTSKVNSYMNYTFDPTFEISLSTNLENTFQLYNIKITETNITNIKTLMNQGGDLYVGQAVSYMKYKEVGDGLERLLGNLSLLKETEASGTIITYKQNTEEKLYKIDEKILLLMNYIDGIGFDTIGFSASGNITTSNSFIKKVCNFTPTKENVGVNNDVLFSAIQNKYTNTLAILNSIRARINSLQNNLNNKDKARVKHLYLTLIDQTDMKEEEIKKHHRAILEAKEQMDYYNEVESNLIQSINGDMDSIISISEKTLIAINSSLVIIDELIGMQDEATTYITEYENLLYELKGQINNKLYESLLGELQYLNRYKKNTNDSGNYYNYNFVKMKETLLKDKGALLNVIQYKHSKINSSNALWNEFMECINTITSHIQAYSHDHLYFDYSSFIYQGENKTFLSNINQFLENGVMGLIPFEKEEFSHNKIAGYDLPTYLNGISDNTDLYDITSVLRDSLNGGENSFLDIFSDFSKNISGIDSFTNSNEIAKYLIFQEYLSDHFMNFNKDDIEKELKNQKYELEYILMGKSTDYDNLKGVVTKILLTRIMMNLISLISNSQKSGEARVLALSLVGFTGLPALISITKTMILVIWAFVESLVDVTAMLYGFEIQFYKNSNNVQVELNDLYHIDKSYIKNKANNIKEVKSLMGLSYKDYLKMFLYIESHENKVYRSLDLIQLNLQAKYEETFYIKNCLYGLGMNTRLQLKKEFVTLPFVWELLAPNSTDEDYILELSYEYSYY
jgi:hypothetical protein